MPVHPRGNVGKYHTILPPKNADQNTDGFKNKAVEESKEITYKSQLERSSPLRFYSFFSH